MAVASLVLARLVGPAAFAPLAVLLVVNSLAIQVSDFGVGFAVMRKGTDARVAIRSLLRLRWLGLAIVVVGTLVGVVVGGTVGLTIAIASWLWALSSEAYVRKSAALRQGASAEVARAEIAGAGVVALAVAITWWFDPGVLWFAVALVVKHAVEVVLVRSWREAFGDDGEPARSGAEWMGQILTYAVANVDYLVVGVVLTAPELSAYVIAFRMSSALPALLGTPITSTAFVALADALPADRSSIRAALVRRAWIAGIAGGVAVLVLSPLVPLFLGTEWKGTGWLMAILAPAAPFRMLLGTAVANAVTLGAARRVVQWELCRLVAMAFAAFAGARFGLVPATAVVAVITIVSLIDVHRRSAALAGGRLAVGEGLGAAAAVAAVIGLALVALAVGA